jgi:hypothetical protein
LPFENRARDQWAQRWADGSGSAMPASSDDMYASVAPTAPVSYPTSSFSTTTMRRPASAGVRGRSASLTMPTSSSSSSSSHYILQPSQSQSHLRSGGPSSSLSGAGSTPYATNYGTTSAPSVIDSPVAVAAAQQAKRQTVGGRGLDVSQLPAAGITSYGGSYGQSFTLAWNSAPPSNYYSTSRARGGVAATSGSMNGNVTYRDLAGDPLIDGNRTIERTVYRHEHVPFEQQVHVPVRVTQMVPVEVDALRVDRIQVLMIIQSLLKLSVLCLVVV